MSKSPTGAVRRVAAGLLAGSLTVLGIALAPTAGATEDAELTEASGNTRYGTAGALATMAYPDGASCVIVASGEVPFDSLAASGLAGAEGCPIILVQNDDITSETAAALGELDPETATIVGGTGRVSEATEDALADMGMTVDRVAGDDRYETARDIANRIGDSSTVIVASGEVAADALAAGSIAANLGAPIVLVTADDIPAPSEEVLAEADDVIIVGGTLRISEDNEAAIVEASNDDEADRLAGENRQETSIEIADYAVETLGWAPDTVILAAPASPSDPGFSPDALASGPLGGLREAPILIVTDADTLGPAEDFIDAHSDTISEVILAGGDAVLSPELGEDALAAAQNVENDEEQPPAGNETVLDSPELVSAAFATQQATTTTVRFTFDEAVTGKAPVAGSFWLITSAGTRFAGTQAQTSATDTTSVSVVFSTTAEQFAQVTVATVDFGAVRDASGKDNPEGDAGLSSFSVTSGATTAPDLLSVGNFRADVTGTGMLVDFTFDEAAFLTGVRGGLLTTYQDVYLVGADGANYQLFDDVTGQGTTTLTFHISDQPGIGFDANTTTVSALTIARGVVNNGAIRDATADLTPLETADANGSGNTSTPDLVSATFNADATSGAGAAIDQVTYTFDAPVTLTLTGTAFNVYQVDSTQVAGTGTAIRSTTSDTDVIVDFADGTLATAVGASVNDNAVNAATGNTALNNAPDEVAVQGVSFSAGRTAGPDLIGARLEAATTNAIDGTTATYRVVYTFDEAVAAAGFTAANFKVYTGTTGTAGAAYATGAGAGCTVSRSTTNTSEVFLSGCTSPLGASLLTPTAGFLNGGILLAAVDNGAVTAADAGPTNPEGSEVIVQP